MRTLTLLLILSFGALSLYSQKVTWSSGVARNPYESAHPELWRGLVGLWAPSVGVQGMRLWDFSLHRNHGTMTNMTQGSWVGGKNGWALEFDGSDDYIDIPDDLSLDLNVAGGHTWSFWIRPDGFAQWTGVWSQNAVVGSFPDFSIYAHSTTNGTWGPVTNGISAGWQTTGSNRLVIHSGDNDLSVGRLSHVIVTYDGSQAQASRMKIYIDGVDATDTSDVHSIGTISNINPVDIRIGDDSTAGDPEFDGLIDDARFYSRGLTAIEVRQLNHVFPGDILRIRERIHGSPPAPSLAQGPLINFPLVF